MDAKDLDNLVQKAGGARFYAADQSKPHAETYLVGAGFLQRFAAAVLAHQVNARDIGTDVIRTIAELPDRQSPDDQPELMQATAEEVQNAVSVALEKALEGIEDVSVPHWHEPVSRLLGHLNELMDVGTLKETDIPVSLWNGVTMLMMDDDYERRSRAPKEGS